MCDLVSLLSYNEVGDSESHELVSLLSYNENECCDDDGNVAIQIENDDEYESRESVREILPVSSLFYFENTLQFQNAFFLHEII